MSEPENQIIMYGTPQCADCKRAKEFFESAGISYVYKDAEDPEIAKEMLSLNGGKNITPTIIYGDKILLEPSNEELSSTFAAHEEPDKQSKLWDVVMVGAGPASLSAAIYTSREDLSTLIIEKGVIGGLAAITDQIDNYPGFRDGVTGMELSEQMFEQAKRFGAEIELAEVETIEQADGYKIVKTKFGDFKARAVLVATGSDYRKIGVEGEDTYYGRGVHYCATCDGAFYRDKKLVIVGGGNSAAQEALFLTRFASSIEILVRSEWRASDVLIKEVEAHEKITVHTQTTTDKIVGEDNKVVGVIGTNKATNEQKTFTADGVFVFVGLDPNTGFIKDLVDLDEQGLIQTDSGLMTSMNGVFCAGDVRSGATLQIASASGEGATAALKIRHFLEDK